MPLPRLSAPRMALVRQGLPNDHIEDVRRDTREKLLGRGLRDRIRPGARVSITAGSRGIGSFIELLSGIADAVRACGGTPFIIPAMGSHGGATPQGQREILRRLGVDEVDAPVEATMETRSLGAASNGAVAHLDEIAAQADGIIVLGRTKTHPESAEELASGLLKMCTVGLGKQAGAQEAHSHGLWDSVKAVPRVQMAHAKILCGVAVVENGYRQPAAIEVVPPSYDAFLEADQRLLLTAKKYHAKIPFEELDLLIVDELGKTVSGAGMDPNVIGLERATGKSTGRKACATRIAVLSLTHGSLGNGLGIGMADFTTRRFADAYDPVVSYVNLLTASEPGGSTREGPIPLALPSDRDAIEVALYSALPGPRPRVCRIRNTALLDELWISEELLKEAAALRVVEPAAPMAFDSEGNLFTGT